MIHPLSNIEGILLDMNQTFMFGEDNFDEHQDFYETYLKLGGKRLKRNTVNTVIRECYCGMDILYKDPEHFERFPTVRVALKTFSKEAEALAKGEIDLLIDVFAMHELGKIPGQYADFLTILSGSYPLGLVANIWAPKNFWLVEFKKAGVREVFEIMIFSSVYSFIKPSVKIYQQALSGFSVKDVSKIAFIGDSLTYDMKGALDLGFKTIWINQEAFEKNSQRGGVHSIIPDLLYLKEV